MRAWKRYGEPWQVAAAVVLCGGIIVIVMWRFAERDRRVTYNDDGCGTWGVGRAESHAACTTREVGIVPVPFRRGGPPAPVPARKGTASRLPSSTSPLPAGCPDERPFDSAEASQWRVDELAASTVPELVEESVLAALAGDARWEAACLEELIRRDPDAVVPLVVPWLDAWESPLVVLAMRYLLRVDAIDYLPRIASLVVTAHEGAFGVYSRVLVNAPHAEAVADVLVGMLAVGGDASQRDRLVFLLAQMRDVDLPGKLLALAGQQTGSTPAEDYMDAMLMARSPEMVPAYTKLLQSPSVAVAGVGAYALASIGTSQACAALVRQAQQATASGHAAVCHDAIREIVSPYSQETLISVVSDRSMDNGLRAAALDALAVQADSQRVQLVLRNLAADPGSVALHAGIEVLLGPQRQAGSGGEEPARSSGDEMCKWM